ncbi:MAG: hypothetical protein ABW252_08820 [Polyangiales bacterium]
MLAGCGEVEHCVEESEPGCRNAAPREDGRCAYDLVAYNLAGVGARCLKVGSDEDPCRDCAEGAMCVPDEGRCSQFCEAPPVLPGSGAIPAVITCEAAATTDAPAPAALAFEDVCKRRCELECQRLAQLCGSACAAGHCDRPEVQSECASDCPAPTASGGRDLACLTRSCEDQRLSRCNANLTCPDGRKVDCKAVTCTNDCAFADDGQCDDGDIIASARNDCAWGSDCADCGVRRGTLSPGYLGNVCRYHSNCKGGTQLPSTAEAWCVASGTLEGSSRCMPDCSRGQRCADGFACREVTFATEAGGQAPIAEGTLTSQACVPLLCL